MRNNHQPIVDGDQINLGELFRVLWDGKILFLVTTLFFVILFTSVATVLPSKYVSSSVLAPSNTQAGNLPDALSKLGSMASLAGLGFGEVDSESRVAQEIMKSWGFLEGFIERNNLQVPIYAATGWNKESNTLIINESIYDEVNQEWLIEGDNGQLRGPSSWELFERFSEMLSLSSDIEAGLITLSIEYYSPYVAKQWVDLIYAEINLHMQQRKLGKVNSNIEYLEAQIEKTSISHMETVFYTIIEEQIKNKMLVEATPEHTFLIVSQSMVPEVESGPRRIILVVFGTLLGVILSILLILIRNSSYRLSKELSD